MCNHLFISPHLDDAILSCGDYINKLISTGNAVRILTVFTGSPEAHKLSESAKKFHSSCQLGDDAAHQRCIEDKKVMLYMNCEYRHMGYYECLYRHNIHGQYLYPDLNNIYHLEWEKELELIEELKERLLKEIAGFDVIYSPLGLGNHADHILVKHVVNFINSLNIKQVFFYEEVPYVCADYNRDWVADINTGLKPVVYEISHLEWKSKIEAIKMYSSQIKMLFADELEMIDVIYRISKKYNNDKFGIRLWTNSE